MKKLMLIALLAAFAASPVFAFDDSQRIGDGNREERRDKIKGERQEYRQEKRQERGDEIKERRQERRDEIKERRQDQ